MKQVSALEYQQMRAKFLEEGNRFATQVISPEVAARVPSSDSLQAVWLEPFGVPNAFVRQNGWTLLEIVNSIPNLPERFHTHGIILVDDVKYRPYEWQYVRPKPAISGRPILVTITMPLADGGDESGVKRGIIGLVAAIALTIVTAGIAGGTLIPGLSAIGAKILAGVVGLAGSLAVAALSAPPQQKTSELPESKVTGQSSYSGNVMQAGGTIPRVIGTRRVFPMYGQEPIIERIGQNEYVEGFFVLAGPHAISDLRVDNTPVDQLNNVTYLIREGWDSDLDNAMVTRYGRTFTPNIALSKIRLDPDDTDYSLLATQTDPNTDLPVWHGMLTRPNADEWWGHFDIPEGLYTESDSDKGVAIPIRMRIRRLGTSTWINCPEFHVAGRISGLYRFSVKMFWKTAPAFKTRPPLNRGIYAVYSSTPDQTSPYQPGWTANSYFYTGSNETYYTRGSYGTSGVRNIDIKSEGLELYLDPATFPVGDAYEVQFMRGAGYIKTDFTPSTYVLQTGVRNLFGYRFNLDNTAIIAQAQDIPASVYVTRHISVKNEYPIKQSGLCTIAIRMRDQSMTNVSCIASGYVRDYNSISGEWDVWTTTSNIAPHYRDVLIGKQNNDPLPDELRNDASFVALRQWCIDNGFSCDYVAEKDSLTDVLELLASCAWGKPYQSDIWGVVLDYDRYGELPVRIFTPRNSSNFQWEQAFPVSADTLRINWPDINNNYETLLPRIITISEYFAGTRGLTEEISYEGIVYEALIDMRGRYDLRQGYYRNIFYSVSTSAHAIRCRRGDLVALQNDVIDIRQIAGRIKEIIVDNVGTPTVIEGVVIDEEVTVSSATNLHTVPNLHAVTNLHDVGVTLGAVIQGENNTTYQARLIPSAVPTELIFQTPLTYTTNIAVGCLVGIGNVTEIYKRMIVYAIAYNNKDLNATITMVDEAPEVFGELYTSFIGTEEFINGIPSGWSYLTVTG